jgi:hypothetical protein
MWLAAPGASRAQALARGESIYQFIQNHIDPETGRLNEAGVMLPDEPQWRKYSRFRTVPGALEGMGTHHVQWAGSEKTQSVVVLLVEIAVGSAEAEQALFEVLRADDVQTYYQEAIDAASRRINSPEPHLHDFARRLAMQGQERAQVKFGLALLSAIADSNDLGIVLTLGLHDEFGLYAAEALTELAPEPQQALWQMARDVSGWGRIHAVERMTAATDPELRRWLLTEGFRNSVSPQYLAYQCAVLADLKGALEAQQADRAVLIGAADLLRTLAQTDGPRNLDSYPDGIRAAELFLTQVGRRRDSLSYFLAADALHNYANKGRGAADSAQRERIAQLSEQIVSDRAWPGRVKKAAANDKEDLQQAELAAQRLGVDTFDIQLRRLAKGSSDAQRWMIAFRSAGTARVSKVVAIAERKFARRLAEFDQPTEQSPTLSTRDSKALEAVLQGLAQYPGLGISLVSPSITYPDPRVRRAAVDVLVRWGVVAVRNDTIRKRLSNAAGVESDEGLQARIVALLNSD